MEHRRHEEFQSPEVYEICYNSCAVSSPSLHSAVMSELGGRESERCSNMQSTDGVRQGEEVTWCNSVCEKKEVPNSIQ